MLKKYVSKFLPTLEMVKQNRWLRPFGTALHHPNMWHLHRRSVAGGVAVGLFCGLIPGPFQMIGAALMAVLFRVNLPVALATTFYTNPLTIAPLYLLAYEIGKIFTGHYGELSPAHFVLPEMNWSSWHSAMLDWVATLGKPLAVGLPILALGLAVLGYFIVRVLWYAMVVRKWRKRAARHGVNQ